MPSLQTALPPELADNAIRRSFWCSMYFNRHFPPKCHQLCCVEFSSFSCRPIKHTLYHECLRRAKYVGHRQHNTKLLVDMVRQQFKRHMHETDSEVER